MGADRERVLVTVEEQLTSGCHLISHQNEKLATCLRWGFPDSVDYRFSLKFPILSAVLRAGLSSSRPHKAGLWALAVDTSIYA